MRKKTGIIILALMMTVSCSACGSGKKTSGGLADKITASSGKTESGKDALDGLFGGNKTEEDTEEGSTICRYPRDTETTEQPDTEVPRTEDPRVDDTETEEPATEETPTERKKDRFPDRPNADTGQGTPKVLQVGDVAPDFTVDLKGGGSFRLSDYDDEVVLINFWATWCGPCVGELPAFEQLKDDGYNVLGIDLGEDAYTTNEFSDQNGYTFNVGSDPDYRISSYYPTDGIPYTVIVDHGVIAKIQLGAMAYSDYKAMLDEIR